MYSKGSNICILFLVHTTHDIYARLPRLMGRIKAKSEKIRHIKRIIVQDKRNSNIKESKSINGRYMAYKLKNCLHISYILDICRQFSQSTILLYKLLHPTTYIRLNFDRWGFNPSFYITNIGW